MLGQNLREYRIKNRYSQIEIARLLNVTKQTVSNWEKDKRLPCINTLIELAKLYNITLDSLVGIDMRNSYIELLNIISNFDEDERDKLLDFLKVVAD